MKRACIFCKKELVTRHQIKYCSSKCQSNRRRNIFLKKWKEGRTSGTIGIKAKNISGHVRKYLISKYGDKCSLCGWNKVNPHTGRVPVEVDHIDGDAENSSEGNLRLLCPNCHSLTPHFRNLNKGRGRKWRMDKYVKNALPTVSV